MQFNFVFFLLADGFQLGSTVVILQDFLKGFSLQSHGFRAVLTHANSVAVASGVKEYDPVLSRNGKKGGTEVQCLSEFSTAKEPIADSHSGHAAAGSVLPIVKPGIRLSF